MKEFLFQLYKKHKKESFADKFFEKVSTPKQLLMCMTILSFIPTTLMQIFHFQFTNNFIMNLFLTETFSFVLSCAFFALFGTYLHSKLEFHEINLEINIRETIRNNQEDKQLKDILLKVNLLSIDEFSEKEILNNETFNAIKNQLNEHTFSEYSLYKVAKLASDPNELNHYYSQNKEFLETPYEQSLQLMKTKIANIIIKDEKRKQEKIDFIKENSTENNKEEVILKLNKKMTLSL